MDILRRFSRPFSARHPLVRDITIVLSIKVVVLAALYAAFFGPSNRPEINSDSIGQHLFDAHRPAIERSDGDV